MGLAIGRDEQFHQSRQIGAVAFDLEHRFASVAVKRLEDEARHARRGNGALHRANA